MALARLYTLMSNFHNDMTFYFFALYYVVLYQVSSVGTDEVLYVMLHLGCTLGWANLQGCL